MSTDYFILFLKRMDLFSVHVLKFSEYSKYNNPYFCLFKYKKRNYCFHNNSFFYDLDINLHDISCNFYSSTIESLLPIASFGIGFASTQILPGRPASFAPLKTTVKCPSVSKLDWAISPTAVMRYSF